MRWANVALTDEGRRWDLGLASHELAPRKDALGIHLKKWDREGCPLDDDAVLSPRETRLALHPMSQRRVRPREIGEFAHTPTPGEMTKLR